MLAQSRDDTVWARDVPEYLLDDPSDEAYEDHRVQESGNESVKSIACILGKTAGSACNHNLDEKVHLTRDTCHRKSETAVSLF
jgi:hypothetical protein